LQTLHLGVNERRIHQIFEIGVLLKGVDALIECAGGILLYVVSTATIVDWVNALTQEELIEDPRDFVATHLREMAQHFSVSAQSFYGFYLLSHGAVKLLLVIGLLRNKLWAYPVSLVVLVLFVVYQLYRYSYTGSPGLIALSVFDVFILILIWHEWQLLRHHGSGTPP